ncbi:MAG: VanZ family protein [Actinobacteria bacterium]|nr:VanZ family protein [Actinomycetota bacterium]
MRSRRYLLTGVAAVYFGALVGLTFVPGSAADRQFWVWPFVAFVPVGILLVLILGRRRWWAAVAFSVLGSAWIEAAQTVWMPSGYAKLSDIGWATSGAIAGIIVTYVLTSAKLRAARAHEPHRIVAQGGRREIPQD